MKTKVSAYILVISLSAGLFITNAQSGNNLNNKTMQEGSIEQQFHYVRNKSSDYQDYKVIKKALLFSLQSHVKDSLEYYKRALEESHLEIEKQKEAYENLEKKIKAIQEELDQSHRAADNIGFFGKNISKSLFKKIFYGSVFALLLSLAFFIFKYKNSQKITDSTLKELSELEEEYNTHRARALEREQLLNRKLQDEINKNRNLTQPRDS